MLTSWDKDFVFADGPKHGFLKSATLVPSQTSGTIEDWDVELLPGEGKRDRPRQVKLLPRDSGSEDLDDVFFDSDDDVSSLFSYDDGQSQHRLETLLEYLDGHKADNDDGADIPTEKSLPRPPALFSAYRRPGGHNVRGVAINSTKEDDVFYALATRESTTCSQGRVFDKSEQRQLRDLVMSSQIAMQRGKRVHTPALSPHAPESAQGVVSWLLNLRAKVRSTRAVVARPTPKIVNSREYERLPSEEVALERQLRIAEMTFCSAEAGVYLSDATQKVKCLLRCIDAKRIGHLETSRALIELETDSGICDDLETRTSQCAARLVRLTCRVAQLCERIHAPHDRIDAVDLAMLRRCCLALAGDIRGNIVARLDIELLVDEALAHLALLHCRVRRRTNLCAAGGCWCSALPPIPRASFVRIIEMGRSLAFRNHSAEELEARALADILLDSMGYSPLTAESLCEDDSSLESSDVANPGTAGVSLGCDRSDAAKGSFEQIFTKDLESKLAMFVRILPATSLSRAKVALALGISHLRGGERLIGSVAATANPGSSSSPSVGASSSVPRSSSRLSHAKKHGGCVAASVSNGNMPGTASFFLLKKHQLSPQPHHAAQTELRVAEMLLFEATCVLEQHTTTQPIDLPFYACQYGSELLENSAVVGRRAATSYSALACSMGFTTLRALARVLDRRSKHAYAVLALEVCISILELRNDLSERHRLQRELAVVSARQGSRDCSRYCIRVLKDLDDKFHARCRRAAATRVPRSRRPSGEHSTYQSIGGMHVLGNKLDVTPSVMVHSVAQEGPCSHEGRFNAVGRVDMSAAALADVHEAALATELVASRAGKLADDEDGARLILVELLCRIGYRIEVTFGGVASAFELQALLDRTALGLAKLELDLHRPSEAAAVIDACLASGRKSSSVRRIALLSWAANVRLNLGDARGCELALCRIKRLRASIAHQKRRREAFILAAPVKASRAVYTAPLGGAYSNLRRLCMTPLVAGEEGTSGVASSIQSCLLSHCSQLHDIGELAARCNLLDRKPLAALRHLAPTVAAVEAVVSRLGTHSGLFELGRLYHLRGVAQEALSCGALRTSNFPLRVTQPTVYINEQACKQGGPRSQANRPQRNTFGRAHTLDTDPKSAAVSGVVSRGSLQSLNWRSMGFDDRAPFSKRVARVAMTHSTVVSRTGSAGTSLEIAKGPQPLEPRSQTESSALACLRETSETVSWSILDRSSEPHAGPQHVDSSKRTRRRRSLSSRHYRAYMNGDDLAVDALRWYRHALECFKSRDDDVGVASSASAFARLQLEKVIIPVAFNRVPLSEAIEVLQAARARRAQSPRELGCSPRRLDDIDAAARCALSLAALVCEPLLLLETYLNVAEARLLHRDRIGAIAHWWEARELFLRLFVVGNSIPSLQGCRRDYEMLGSLRAFLERLIRFLFACDSAMINENVILLEVLVLFERDARIAMGCPEWRITSAFRETPMIGTTVTMLSGMCSSKGASALDLDQHIVDLTRQVKQYTACTASRKHEVWEWMARTRNDVQTHRQRGPFSQICELRDKNRATLRVLAAKMRMLATDGINKGNSGCKLSRQGVEGVRQGDPTVYILHVASMMVLYCPLTGARHTVAFGQSPEGVASTRIPALPSAALSQCQGAYTSAGTDIVRDPSYSNSGLSQMRHGGLSTVSAEFISRLAVESRALSKNLVIAKVCEHPVDELVYARSSHEAVIQARSKRVEEIVHALALPTDAFSVLVACHGTGQRQSAPANDRECTPLRVRIVCSERAQLIPWECCAGPNVCISRSHCISAPAHCRIQSTSPAYIASPKHMDLAKRGSSAYYCFCEKSLSMKAAVYTWFNSKITAHNPELSPGRFVQKKVPRHDTPTKTVLLGLISELCSPEARSAAQLTMTCDSHRDTLRELVSSRTRDQACAVSCVSAFCKATNGRYCIPYVRCGTRPCSERDHKGSNIVILDLLRLFVPTRDFHALLDEFRTCFILFVPPLFLQVIEVELRENLSTGSHNLEDNASATSTSSKSLGWNMDRWAVASFAQRMSIKYAVPIVHYIHS